MFSFCLAILTSSFSLFNMPEDSVDIFVTNNLNSTSICKIYYLINGQSYLHGVSPPFSLPSDSTISVTLPSLLLNRIVFEDENNTVYYISHYPASSNGDTIIVSPANKEFGLFFDRIYGSYPIALLNSSMIPLYSISIAGSSFPETNLLRGRILLPGEILCIWTDSGTTAEIVATDINGNLSSVLTGFASAADTLFQFKPSYFYHNGKAIDPGIQGSGSWVVNCLPDRRIVLIEAYDADGFFTEGVDCHSSPLQTWDRIFLSHPAPLSHIVCTDLEGRTYSLIDTDIFTDEYLVDMLSLDFGFSFPE